MRPQIKRCTQHFAALFTLNVPFAGMAVHVKFQFVRMRESCIANIAFARFIDEMNVFVFVQLLFGFEPFVAPLTLELAFIGMGANVVGQRIGTGTLSSALRTVKCSFRYKTGAGGRLPSGKGVCGGIHIVVHICVVWRIMVDLCRKSRNLMHKIHNYNILMTMEQ